jgi:hypothetical protein
MSPMVTFDISATPSSRSASPPLAAVEAHRRVARDLAEAELIAVHFPLAGVAYVRGKAHNSVMPPLLDFWFDFASTYSYPTAMQITPLAQQAGVIVRFRPFLLGPVCVVYRRESGALVTDLVELDDDGKGRRVIACYGSPPTS